MRAIAVFMLLAPAVANAGVHGDLQIGGTLQGGPLRYSDPQLRLEGLTERSVTKTVIGIGPAFDIALGSRGDRWAIAGEGGIGLPIATSRLGSNTLGAIPYVRAGVRAEWMGTGSFVRLAIGAQRTAFFIVAGEDIAPSTPEPPAVLGPFMAATLGARGRAGLFGRIEVARMFGSKTTFTPITLVIGVNIAL